MKQAILQRYENTPDQKIIIDVSVGGIQELYEDYDSAASYIKKDLDQDFVEYLLTAVREIRSHAFVIRINLPAVEAEQKKQRLAKSLNHYFAYMEEVKKHEIRKLLKRSLAYFFLGITFLLISLTFSLETMQCLRLGRQIFQEGLVIGAWVSMWQAFANLLFQWGPLRQDIRIYRRIGAAPVIFQEVAK